MSSVRVLKEFPETVAQSNLEEAQQSLMRSVKKLSHQLVLLEEQNKILYRLRTQTLGRRYR